MSNDRTVLHEQKQRVQRFFGQDDGWQGGIYRSPDDWFARAIVRRRAYTFQMLRMLPVLKNGYALDVGCGSGVYLDGLEEDGFGSFGVDYSMEMLRACRTRRNGAPLSKNSPVCRADIEALPFQKETFDLILCIGVLGYLLSDGRALEEMRRILKPGRFLVVNLTNLYSLSNLPALLYMKLCAWLRPAARPAVQEFQPQCTRTSVWIMEHSLTHYRYKWYDVNKFERMMAALGFRMIDTRTFGYEFRFLRRMKIIPARIPDLLERALESLLHTVRLPYLSSLGETYTALFQKLETS